MIKKSFFAVLVVAFLATPFTPVQAFDLSGGRGRFDQNSGSQDLGEVDLRMDTATPAILAEFGVRLTLAQTQWALWEKDVTTLQVTGNAVTGGKILAEVPVTYSSDLKSLYIPIKANWVVGDQATISGLKIRIYDRASGSQPVGVDLDGDGTKDLDSNLTVKIDESNPRTDQTNPYAPGNLTGNLLKNPWQVALAWTAPVDYDLISFEIIRSLTRAGKTDETVVLTGSPNTTFTDNTVQANDTVTYSVYSMDRRGNRSEPSVLTLTVAENTPETEDPETNTDTDTETDVTPAPETEAALLTRLFNYYKIRYQIKCGNGMESSSACLWARIDVIYAEQKLDRSDVKISLSERDLYLMGLRIKYPRARYEENCVNVDELPPFCNSLERALMRADYFLNQ